MNYFTCGQGLIAPRFGVYMRHISEILECTIPGWDAIIYCQSSLMISQSAAKTGFPTEIDILQQKLQYNSASDTPLSIYIHIYIYIYIYIYHSLLPFLYYSPPPRPNLFHPSLNVAFISSLKFTCMYSVIFTPSILSLIHGLVKFEMSYNKYTIYANNCNFVTK